MSRGKASCCAIATLCLAIVGMGQEGPPEIASVNEGVRRYQTLQIYGEGFEPGKTKVYQWQPKVGPVPKPPKQPRGPREWRSCCADPSGIGKAPPLPARPPQKRATRRVYNVTPQVISVRCEVGIPQFPQCFVVWVENSRGLSKPFLANRPKLWWMDKEAAAPGEHVRLFGRNLWCWRFGVVTVALKHRASGKFFIAKTGYDVPWGLGPEARMSGEYRMGFELPADLPLGEYEVYLHNGSGGAWGWSNSLRLTVGKKATETISVVRVTDFGAKGDGLADDTEAIEKAIAAAKAKGGGKVHFPPGLFYVTHTILLPPNVGLHGSGKMNTILAAHPNRPFQKTPPAFMKETMNDPVLEGWAKGFRMTTYSPLILAGSHCRLEDIGLECRGKAEWTVMVYDASGAATDFHASRVRFGPPAPHWHGHYDANAVRRGGQSGITFFVSASDVVIEHCDFYGGSVRGFREPNKRWRVAYCNFVGTPNNYYGGFPSPRGMVNCIIEHNRARYPSRGLVFHGGAMHNFVFNNIIVQTRGDGGGEPYLFEGTNSTFVGRATAASPTKVVCKGAAWEPGTLCGAVCLILKGRGFGQYRFVKNNTADRLDLAEPWRVTPDSTTVISCARYYVENILFANSDVRCNISHYYGNCIGNVWAAQRTFQSLGFAFAGFARGKNSGPCYYNDFLDGSFRQMRGMVCMRANTTVPNTFDAPVVVGNRLARCDIENVPVVLWERWTPKKGKAPWKRWQTITRYGWRTTLEKTPGQRTRPNASPTLAFNIVEECAIQVRGGPHIYVTGGCANNTLCDNVAFDTETPASIKREP